MKRGREASVVGSFLTGSIAAYSLVVIARFIFGNVVDRASDAVPHGLEVNLPQAFERLPQTELWVWAEALPSRYWSSNPEALSLAERLGSINDPFIVQRFGRLLAKSESSFGLRTELLVRLLMGGLRPGSKPEDLSGIDQGNLDELLPHTITRILSVSTPLIRQRAVEGLIGLREAARDSLVFKKTANELAVGCLTGPDEFSAVAVFWAANIKEFPNLPAESLRVLASRSPALAADMLAYVLEKDPDLGFSILDQLELPTEVIEGVVGRQKSDHGNNFLSVYFEKLVRKNPSGLVAILDRVDVSQLPRAAQRIAVRAMLMTGSDPFAQNSNLAKSSREKSDLLDESFAKIPEARKLGLDVNMARNYLSARLVHNEGIRDSNISLAIRVVAMSDYSEAMRLIEMCPADLQGDLAKKAAHERISARGGNDTPQQILDFARQLPVEYRTQMKLEAVGYAAEKFGSKILPMIAELDLPPEALPRLYGNILTSNFVEWWAGENGSGDQEHEAAVLKAAKSLPEDIIIKAVEKISSQYLYNSPADAATWLAKVPPGTLADRATVSFAHEWITTDPAGATDWIERMKPGRVRDLSIKELVVAGVSDLATALQNTLAISSSALQETTAQELVNQWKTVDPDQLLQKIESSNMPPELAAKMRAWIPQQLLKASHESR